MMVKPLPDCVFKQQISWTDCKLGGWLTSESDMEGEVGGGGGGGAIFFILHVQYQRKCSLSGITVHIHPQVLL